jgi:hypothetical protein
MGVCFCGDLILPMKKLSAAIQKILYLLKSQNIIVLIK